MRTMSFGQSWQVVAQLPLSQSVSPLHVNPAAHFLLHGPPQSVSPSPWFLTLSEQVGVWQTRPEHTRLAQSVEAMQG